MVVESSNYKLPVDVGEFLSLDLCGGGFFNYSVSYPGVEHELVSLRVVPNRLSAVVAIPITPRLASRGRSFGLAVYHHFLHTV